MQTGKPPLRSYWEWVKATQDQYTFGFRPPLTVLVSLFALVACATAPIALVLGLLVGEGTGGLAFGFAVAFPAALVLASYAKHQARSVREDKWEPSK